VVAIAAVGVEQIVRMGDFRVDDAYITFSFSKNLAAGNGPVFSHDLRVEGYSNFLWMLLVSLGFLLVPSSDGYVTARILGFGLLAFGLYVVYGMARLSAGRLVALIAPAVMIVCSDLMRATLSGLETTAYVVAIAFGWWVYLREPPKQRRWSLLAFVPAALMRIDGFVPVLIVGGIEVVRSLYERRFSPRALFRWAAPALVIWGAYFAWRYWYYGLPLPTTYYAKQLVDVQQPTRGYDQVWAFLREYGALAILPLMGLPLIRGRRVEALSLWTAVVLYMTFVGLTGGDWMPFQRFFLPVLPLGAVLLAWGMAQLMEELRSQPWPVRFVGGILGLAGMAFHAVHQHMGSLDTNEERAKIAEAKHVKRHTVNNLMAAMDLARWSVRLAGRPLRRGVRRRVRGLHSRPGDRHVGAVQRGHRAERRYRGDQPRLGDLRQGLPALLHLARAGLLPRRQSSRAQSGRVCERRRRGQSGLPRSGHRSVHRHS
jgi:hypothetical protein